MKARVFPWRTPPRGHRHCGPGATSAKRWNEPEGGATEADAPRPQVESSSRVEASADCEHAVSAPCRRTVMKRGKMARKVSSIGARWRRWRTVTKRVMRGLQSVAQKVLASPWGWLRGRRSGCSLGSLFLVYYRKGQPPREACRRHPRGAVAWPGFGRTTRMSQQAQRSLSRSGCHATLSKLRTVRLSCSCSLRPDTPTVCRGIWQSSKRRLCVFHVEKLLGAQTNGGAFGREHSQEEKRVSVR